MPTKVSSAKIASPLGKENIDQYIEFERDECFKKWDYPFGFSQEAHALFWILTAHLGALSYFLCDFSTVPLSAMVFSFLYGYLGVMGVSVGCHRYWSHKTFKAKLPLQVIMMIMQTISMQMPIFKWTLDHRIHHKYTDTDADPQNAKRGFWYSHMMWLFMPKHEDLKVKLKTFNVRDLEADPVVRFQSEYWYPLLNVFSFLLPLSILHYGWGIGWYNAIVLNFMRFVFSLHAIFCVGSVGHLWGDKPYDKNISPTDVNLVALFAGGDGYHNFHHVFPSDYRTSEFGWKLNASTLFIDFFAKIGWAYDLKTVSDETIRKRMMRTGELKSSEEVTSGEVKIPKEHDYLDIRNESKGFNKTALDVKIFIVLLAFGFFIIAFT